MFKVRIDVQEWTTVSGLRRMEKEVRAKDRILGSNT